MEKERSYCNDFHDAYSFFYYLFELEPILVGLKSRYDILSRQRARVCFTVHQISVGTLSKELYIC